MRCRVVGRANNNANVNGGVVYANAPLYLIPQ